MVFDFDLLVLRICFSIGIHSMVLSIHHRDEVITRIGMTIMVDL